MADLVPKPNGYDELLRELVTEVRAAQLRAGVAVNRELVGLYWRIGGAILTRQEQQGWGAKVIDRLAADLRHALPEMRGFSVRNLMYMRAFAEAWPEEEIVQQLLHNLPWGHVVQLMQKVKDPDQRLWYVQKALENGWSRNVLCLQIDRDLYAAQGSLPTNFDLTLPSTESDLARETLKDPYKLDFLGIASDAAERVIQDGLVRHVREFLLELGKGFAFVGERYPLEVGGDAFELDLLFYHLDLRRFVVIELKAGKLKPADTGQLNFYLAAADDLIRRPGDNPTIGLILCREKNNVVAEYALRGISQPMAISSFELTKVLPEELEKRLPTVEQLELEFLDDSGED